jgi:DNA repair protein RecO (recombination protein O)
LKDLSETEGIILRSMKYSESSVIIEIYTLDYGLKSFIINGVRSSKSKQGPSIFQVMNLVKIAFYNKETDALLRLVSHNYAHIYQSISTDVLKSCVALFLAECTRNSIKEKDSYQELYYFIKNSFIELDQKPLNELPNFYLRYMLNLSRFLGFYPHNNYCESLPFFDMMHGDFADHMIETKYSMSHENSYLLHQLMIDETIKINKNQRDNLLDELLIYYSLHLDNFKELKSLPVLREVLS